MVCVSLTLKGALVWRWRLPVMPVVIGRWSASRRGCSAAGAGLRRGHGGRLEGAAVGGPRLEGTTRGSVAQGQRGGGRLERRG